MPAAVEDEIGHSFPDHSVAVNFVDFLKKVQRYLSTDIGSVFVWMCFVFILFGLILLLLSFVIRVGCEKLTVCVKSGILVMSGHRA